MRRTDREVKDPVQIRAVLEACQVMRIGLQDGARVYVVPLNFGFVETDGRWTLYFHGAKEGRKAELIARNGYAGFEMDTGYRVYGKETACSYTAAFQSIIGEGSVSAVEELEEKRTGLLSILRQATGKPTWTFDEKMLNAVQVFRLDVEELSCKEHL